MKKNKKNKKRHQRQSRAAEAGRRGGGVRRALLPGLEEDIVVVQLLLKHLLELDDPDHPGATKHAHGIGKRPEEEGGEARSGARRGARRGGVQSNKPGSPAEPQQPKGLEDPGVLSALGRLPAACDRRDVLDLKDSPHPPALSP